MHVCFYEVTPLRFCRAERLRLSSTLTLCHRRTACTSPANKLRKDRPGVASRWSHASRNLSNLPSVVLYRLKKTVQLVVVDGLSMGLRIAELLMFLN
jgi:hypothetical protein